MDLTQCHLMRTNLENLLAHLMAQISPGGPKMGPSGEEPDLSQIKCTLNLEQFSQIVGAYRQLHDYMRSYAAVILPPTRPVAVPLEVGPGDLVDVEYGKPYLIVFRAPEESLLDAPAPDLEYPPIPLAQEIPGSPLDEEEASHLKWMRE